MAEIVRHIGLSLGADIDWPLCFEALVKRLDVRIPHDGDTLRFEVDRVTIEPYDLCQPVKYDLVVDRLTHWYHTSREWIKKGILLNNLYVFNNPWSVQANEKHTTYCAMMALGMPIPSTWMVPPKAYEPTPDLKTTLARYAKLFDVRKIGDRIGWPMFMKPFDGGGWRAVTKCDNPEAVYKAYEESGKAIMHLQSAVAGFDRFVRCIGFGPQTHCVLYDPDAPLHDRYTMASDFISKEEEAHLRKITLTINAFFDWEFNSCESLRRGTVWHPIDFANPCPDSQVTSLHYHFPWLVKAYVRWSLFCAGVKRRMRKNQHWQPFYDIAALDLPYEEKLDRYEALADERFDRAQFDEWSAKHLGHLDEVAWEFFGSGEAKDAVRQKVTAIYPAHEIEQFTELFWSRIQKWRADEKPSKGL